MGKICKLRKWRPLYSRYDTRFSGKTLTKCGKNLQAKDFRAQISILKTQKIVDCRHNPRNWQKQSTNSGDFREKISKTPKTGNDPQTTRLEWKSPLLVLVDENWTLYSRYDMAFSGKTLTKSGKNLQAKKIWISDLFLKTQKIVYDGHNPRNWQKTSTNSGDFSREDTEMGNDPQNDLKN